MPHLTAYTSYNPENQSFINQMYKAWILVFSIGIVLPMRWLPLLLPKAKNITLPATFALVACGELVLGNPTLAPPGPYCAGDVIDISFTGTNLPDGEEIQIFIDDNPTYNPFSGGGTLIGTIPIDYSCSNCPTLLGIMADPCITVPVAIPVGEDDNEFLMMSSGCGFNVSDLIVDFDANNNIGGVQNSDIGNGCPFMSSPNASLLSQLMASSNCPNLINAAGPSSVIPAGAIVVVFTDTGNPDVGYNFNDLCATGLEIYVLQSSCERTTGAFTNNPGTLRTYSITIGACSDQISWNNDAGYPSGSGTSTSVFRDENGAWISISDCTSIPFTGINYPDIPNSLSTFSYTIPAGTCGAGGMNTALYISGMIDLLAPCMNMIYTPPAASSFLVSCPNIEDHPDSVAQYIAVSAVNCEGDSTGSISFDTTIISGGVRPFIFDWDYLDTPIEEDFDFDGADFTIGLYNIPAGSYQVLVTDANGCSDSITIVVPDSQPIIVNAQVTNVKCFGQSNGVINISSVTGPLGPRVFNWDWSGTPGSDDNLGGPPSNTIDAEDLLNPIQVFAGDYYLTVTINGSNYTCTFLDTFTVTQPALLTVAAQNVMLSCFGGSGSSTAMPSGGTGPYIYDWSYPVGGPDNATVTGLTVSSPGPNYTVTVTDANLCTATTTITVTQPAALTVSASGSVLPCDNGTGTVTVSVSGGTPNYSFVWSPNAGGATTQNLSGLYSGTYTVTVTDMNGCTGTASASVTVTPPTFSLPPNQSSNVICVAEAQVEPVPPPDSNSCGAPLVIAGPNVSADPICSGTKTYTWIYTDTVTDISAPWVYTYNINDPIDPVINCPAGGVFTCYNLIPPAYTTFSAFVAGGGSASDNCGLDESTFMLSQNISGTCPRRITRTYSIEDSCGNVAQCIQLIDIADNIAPVITCPPGNNYVCMGSVPPAFTTYAAFTAGGGTATDNCGLVLGSFTMSQSSAGTCPRVITRTYTIADSCGNTGQCIQTINVDDNTNPIITCPPGNNYVCMGSVPPAFTTYAAFIAGGGTASDNCGLVQGSFTMSQSSAGTCPRIITRTYTIADSCGNTGQCIQTINVDDNVNPVITCPPNNNYVCMGSVPPAFTTYAAFIAGGGTATDNCGVVQGSFTMSQTDAGTCPRIITRTYTIADSCGNTGQCIQTINVDDNVNPVITCPPNNNYVCIGSVPPAFTTYAAFIAGGGTATDNCGLVQGSFTMSQTDAGTCPRVITRTYTIADSCGNTGQCIQTINVDDNINPVITCPPNNNYVCIGSVPPPLTTYAAFIAGGGTASDNCGLVQGSFTMTQTDAGTCPRVITRTYTIADSCGNTGQCIQTINIDDNVNPVITCPAGGNYVCIGSVPPAFTTYAAFTAGGGTASDNCGLVLGSFTMSQTDAGTCPRVITRTYTIADSCGNTGQCIQTINVDDNVNPVITCPAGGNYVCIGSVPPAFTTYAAFIAGGGTASDNCGLVQGSFTMTQTDAGTCPRIITRTYTIADSCGNTGQCIQTINMDDNVNPVITCPAGANYLCMGSVPPAFTTYAAFIAGGGTASDNCGLVQGSFTMSQTDAGTCPRIITRTYTIADSCGNTGQCIQTINVDDNVNPVITCPAGANYVCIGSVPPAFTTYAAFIAGGGTASDNCGLVQGSFAMTQTDAGTCPRIITRTYTIADSCGNTGQCIQTINVDDNVNPVITCPPGNNYVCIGSVPPAFTTYAAFIAGGGTASDNCGLVQGSFTMSQTDAGTCPRVITRTYTIADSCGNTGQCIQTINVDDNVNPVITCPAGGNYVCIGSVPPAFTTYAAFIAGGGTASDNCGLVLGSFTMSQTDAGTCPRIITRIYTIADSCGNTGQCIQTINVDDNVNPVISCPAGGNYVCIGSVPPAFSTYAAFIAGGGTASDNCGLVQGSFTMTQTDAGTCPRIITRTYTIADSCGNTGQCIQTINVDDSVNPVITCPAGANYVCMGSVPPAFTTLAAFIAGGGTASDNCGLVQSSFTMTQTDAGTCPRIITRTYTIADSCGNTGQCIQTINVDDNVNPVITCPAGANYVCIGSVPPAFTTYAAFIAGGGTASDNCGLVQGSFTMTQTDAGTCPRVITRTYTIADSCGNTGQCIQTINVDDNVNPVITCPPGATIECSAGIPPSFTNYTDFINGGGSASDNCGLVTGSFSMSETDNGTCPRTITRTYTIADSCGNTGQCVQTIIVGDVTDPVITCPSGGTFECNGDVPPALVTYTDFINGGGSASDNCGLVLNTFTLSETDNGTCPRTIIRTYTIADSCGNTSQCIQTIIVDDAISPVISCPSGGTFECIGDVPPSFATYTDFINGGGSASDNCGLLISSFNLNETVSGTCPKTITRTYQIADSCGNTGQCIQTFIVDDAIAPSITCPSGGTFECSGDVPPVFLTYTDFINGGGSASDNCGLLIISFNFTETDNGSCPKTITRTYEIADSCGNISQCVQIFTVSDDEPPVITCPPGGTFECSGGGPAFTTYTDFINGGGTITDNCGILESSFTLVETDNGTCPRTITRTYTIADSCGNTGQCIQNVMIEDAVPPVVICPSDANFECSGDVPPAFTTYTDFINGGGSAGDNCGLVLTSFAVVETDNGTCPRTINRTYSIEDSCGNVGECIQVIVVEDFVPPMITCPSDLSFECTSDVPPAYATYTDFINGGGSASDNCGINISTFAVTESDNGTCPRTITRTYEIADSCGNTGQCVQTIIVDDAIAPVITCPPGGTFECNGDLPPAFATYNDFINGGGTASDNCGLLISSFTVSETDNGTCPRTIVRTYEIADSCGNTTQCIQTIIVDDAIAPLITCPPGGTFECNGDVPPAFATYTDFINGGGTASDNCGLMISSFNLTETDNGTCPRTITRTYTIADSCGNTGQCVQNIIVDDAIAPVITCPAGGTFECTGDVPPAFATYTDFINGGGTASDNCGLMLSSFSLSETDNGTCPRTITRTYTIADSCGNTGQCIQTIIVDDAIAPVISCPAGGNFECTGEVTPAFATYTDFINGGGSASDNCGLVLSSFSLTETDNGTCPRTITRTYTIADSCGNTGQCVQTITVDDPEPPVITCPAGGNFECTADVPPAFTTYATFIAGGGTASDNCGLVVSTFSFTETDNGTCPRTITRTYTIADSCGNTGQCVQTIIVDDPDPPVITCPAGGNFECTGDVPPAFTTYATFISGGGTASDNCGLVLSSFSLTETDNGTCPRTITRTYTIADSCGNTGQCVQTIIVDDAISPVITCPAGGTFECNGDVPPAFTTYATFIAGGGSASDNCGLVVSSFSFTQTDNGTCPRTIIRTYTIADSCGNTGQCVQTIIVDDAIAPAITCPVGGTFECDGDAPSAFATYAAFIAGGGSASDNCGLLVSSFSLTETDNGTCPRTITRTYTIADSCGNTGQCVQTIIVDDAIAPVITCPAGGTFECNDDVPPAFATYAAFVAGGGSASDNCGLLISSFTLSETDNGTCPRTITRTYTIADSCGNTGQCVQTIIVDDAIAPVITCPAGGNFECNGDVTPAFASYTDFINGGGTASDNCGLVLSSFALTETDNGTCPRTITRTYTIADSCGNTGQCIQTILVDDAIAPVITCPAGGSFECTADVPPAFATYTDFVNGGGTASDNCGLVLSSFSLTQTDAGTCPRIITRTYTIADSCGNTGQCVQTITIDDQEPPSITCPSNVTGECVGDIPPAFTTLAQFIAGGGNASDNCGLVAGSFSLTQTDAGTCPRIITRTYTIADSCGNTGQCIQTITIDDPEPPSITCPSDVTGECVGDIPPAFNTLAQFIAGGGNASDNCGLVAGSFSLTQTDAGTCPRIITRTYTIADSCGNTGQCVQTITIDDPEPPSITCPPNVTGECVGDIPPAFTTLAQFIAGGGSASDNCGLVAGSFSLTQTDAGTCPRIITRTYTIADSCGNTGQCVQTITIDDPEPPFITCPPNVTGECVGDIPPAFTTLAQFIAGGGSASDNCGLVAGSFSLTQTDAGTCPRIITRTYTIADSCGNTGQCVQTITIDDPEPPSITCPSNVTGECVSDIPAAYTTLAQFIAGGGSASDNCGLVATSFTLSQTDAGTCPRIITRTYTIADSCGNTGQCVQTITIDDPEPPAISCPANVTGECIEDIPVPFNSLSEFLAGGGTASDNCGLVAGSFSMTQTDAGTCPRIITRTYSIADSCGNTNQCVQSITIDDQEAPVITCPANVTGECIADVPAAFATLAEFLAGGGSASDNCGLVASTFTITQTGAGTCPRIITRTYTIADSCGNTGQCIQTITIDDPEPPSIACPLDVTGECVADIPPAFSTLAQFIAGGGSASDNCGLVESTFTLTETDAGTCPRVITRTYTIADSCGNTGQCVQTITINDIEAPLVTCPGDLSFDCVGSLPVAFNTLAEFLAAGGTATDNCGLDANSFVVDEIDAGTCPRIITRTYTIADSCGNTGQCVQTITIDDNVPPAITCPSDVTGECAADIPPVYNTLPEFIAGGGSASDNCGLVASTFTVSITDGGTCPRIITRTYTIADSCGNTGQCVQTITIDDAELPVITCPANVTEECLEDVAPAFSTLAEFIAGGGSASDNCGLIESSFAVNETNAGSCPRTITRTYTIADSCGNTNQCIQTIIVDDPQDPLITCPVNVTGECIGDVPTAYNTLAEFLAGGGSASDNCGLVENSFTLSELIAGTCPMVITRTYTIADSCGNTGQCVQTITIDDPELPLITCPANVTGECLEDVPPAFNTLAEFIAGGGSASDNCGLIVGSFTVNESVTGTCPRIITRTYTIADSCGNVGQCVQTISIDDPISPVISCPSNITGECIADVPPVYSTLSEFLADGGNASDNCGLVESSFSVTVTDAGTCPRTITRTYSIADSCGNIGQCVQTITIDDTELPIISCPANVTGECVTDVPPAYNTLAEFLAAGGSASDNCGLVAGSFDVIVADAGTCPRTITRTYTIADSCGNIGQCIQTITIDDPEPPVITCPSNVTGECISDVPPVYNTLATFIAGGGSASDNCGLNANSFTVSVTDAGTCPRIITRTYTIADSCGNTSQCIQTITINDLEPPVIICPADVTDDCVGNIPQAFNSLAQFIAGGGSASDNCGLNASSFTVSEVDGGTCPRIITRTYTIADSCGNTTQCVQTFTIDDQEPPVVVCPPNMTEECISDLPPAFNTLAEFLAGGGTATDNCGLVASTFTLSETDAGTCPHTITRTYTVADSCGNTGQCVQIITVDDQQAPIVACPANITGECLEDVPPAFNTLAEFLAGGGNATDNCGLIESSFTVSVSESGTCPRVITRTYTIADSCGNTGQCVQTITIDDPEAPIITCPADITGDCNGDIPAAFNTLAEFLAGGGNATDNCGLVENTFAVSETDAGTCPRTITRTYTIADSCGNTGQCIQTIVIDDVTPPTASNPAPIVVSGCNTPVPAPNNNVVTDAADNCGTPVVAFVSDATSLVGCTETTTRTYSITDACNNSITVTQIITRTVDITPPVIDGPPADITVNCLIEVPPMEDLDYTDNCSPPGSITGTQVGPSGDPLTIIRTWTITDACGNATTVTQTITIDEVLIPLTVDEEFCEGGSVIVNGEIYSTPGTFLDTITSTTGGCDTVVTINITQLDTVVVNLTDEFCENDTYILPDGSTTTVGGSYGPYTFTGGNGCDSTVTLQLTMNPNTTGVFNHNGCEGDNFSIIINGTVYDEGNPTGIEVVPNSNGCDSTITISLVFASTTTGEELYTGCQGDGYQVIVNGTLYNEFNSTGTETLTGPNGCDSIVSIDLTFNSTSTGSETYSGCEGDGYSVIVNGTVYNETNPTGTEILSNGDGCDSTVTISLAFAPAGNGAENYTGCEGDGYEVIVNGTVYNESNPTGTEMFPGPNGCDSIVVINLVFNAVSFTDETHNGCEGDGYSIIVGGTTYNESNPDGIEVLNSSMGCDSTVTIDLNFAPVSVGEELYNGCEGDGYSVVVNGTEYDENNPTGTEVLDNAAGCDSTVTINLTFAPAGNGEENYNGCVGDGYVVIVNGNTYNESNPTGTELFPGPNGCDSTVVINLVFNPETTGSESYNGCMGDGYSVVVDGTLYNESNPTGIEILTGPNGCDSTVTINLVFNDQLEGEELYVGCEGDGYSVVVNGTIYNETNPTGQETFDLPGCDSVVTIDLQFLPLPDVDLVDVGPLCTNAGDVTLVGSPPGGVWSGSVSSNTFDPAAQGVGVHEVIYTVTQGSCVAADTINITVYELMLACQALQDETSPGANDGEAEVTVSGGIAPYDISWSGPESGTITLNADGSFVITDLTPGPPGYTVTVTDNTGCTETCQFTIESAIPCEVVIDDIVVVNATCSAAENGIATVLASGGVGTLEYSLDCIMWQTSNVFAGLAPGNYSVCVRDEICTETGTFTIGADPDPELTATVNDASCGVANGSIIANASGGAFPYMYALDNPPYGFANEFQGLVAGTYTILLQDANLCADTLEVPVGAIGAPTFTINITPASCDQADGTITVTATGGEPPYTYILDGTITQSNNVFTGVTGGAHTIAVEDALGCVTPAQNVNVPENGAPTFTFTTTPSECDEPTGTITIDATGGTPPLTYSITGGPPFFSNDIFTGLGPGVYDIVVHDNAGCEATGQATINTPNGPQFANFEVVNTTCEEDNGEIDFNIIGGTDPITIIIDGGQYSNDEYTDNLPITDLEPDTYTITITDDNGCSAVISGTVVGSLGPELSYSSESAHCDRADGCLILDGQGVPPLMYSINGAAGPFTFITDYCNLVSEFYVIAVKDGNGCIVELDAFVGNIDGPSAIGVDIEAPDCGLTNGMAMVSATGGTPPLMYSTTGFSPQPSNVFNPITPGSYTFTVTDAEGCSSTIAGVVPSTPAPTIISVNTTPTECGEATGTITITATGGLPPLTYSINGNTGPFVPSNLFSGLPSGNYDIAVQSANGCEDTDFTSINSVGAPTGILVTSVCVGDCIVIGMETFCIAGNYSVTLPGGATNGCDSIVNLTLTVDPLEEKTIFESVCVNDVYTYNGVDYTAPGVYVIDTVDAATGCDTILTVDLSELPLEVKNYDVTICAGTLWTDPITGTTYGTAGDHLLDTLDVIGSCDSIRWLHLDFDDFVSSTFNQEICEGQSFTINGLNFSVEGVYPYDTIDAIGACDTIFFLDLVVNPTPVVNAGADMTLDCNVQTVTLDGTTDLGTPLWTGPGINAGNENQLTPSVTQPGIYILTVTTIDGCVASDEVEVLLDPASAVANAGPDTAFNCIVDSIFLQGGPTGPNLIYQWSGPGINAGNENDQNPLITEEGVYILVVTDQVSGCTSLPDEVVVGNNVNQIIAIIQGPTALTCFIDTIDLATIGSTTGPTIQYLWLDENFNIISNSPNFIVTQAGQFTFVVQDTVTGCIDSTTIEISDSTQYPQVNAGPDQLLDCNIESVILTGTTNTNPNITHAWTGPTGGILTDTTLLSVTVGSAGTYVFAAMDTMLGCLNSDTVIVIDNSQLPVANIGLLESITCIDSAAMLDIGTSDTGPEITYEWNGPSINGINTLVIEPTEPGMYSLLVTNQSNGCEALDTIILTLPELPQGIDVDLDLPICEGDTSGSLLVTNVTGGTPPYQYSFEGDTLTSNPLFEGLMAGMYTVQVVDANGCTYEETFTMPDGQVLTIDIGPDIELDLGDSVILNANVSMPWSQIDSIVWASGEHLSCTHCTNPTLYALFDETITATVYVSGCIDQDALTLRVDVDAEIYIPNVFSPNGDGVNDHVTVFADPRVKKIVYLEIFDRWGNQVFVANDIAPNDLLLGWDGTFKNKPMNPAVFAYIARVELINGVQVPRKGDITLVR